MRLATAQGWNWQLTELEVAQQQADCEVLWEESLAAAVLAALKPTEEPQGQQLQMTGLQHCPGVQL